MTKNGWEPEQSSNNREQSLVLDVKGVKIDVGQLDMANNTPCRLLYSGTRVFGQKSVESSRFRLIAIFFIEM